MCRIPKRSSGIAIHRIIFAASAAASQCSVSGTEMTGVSGTILKLGQRLKLISNSAFWLCDQTPQRQQNPNLFIRRSFKPHTGRALIWPNGFSLYERLRGHQHQIRERAFRGYRQPLRSPPSEANTSLAFDPAAVQLPTGPRERPIPIATAAPRVEGAISRVWKAMPTIAITVPVAAHNPTFVSRDTIGAALCGNDRSWRCCLVAFRHRPRMRAAIGRRTFRESG